MLETASASQKTKKGKDNEKSKPTITQGYFIFKEER
jgi:hypothetical protein